MSAVFFFFFREKKPGTVLMGCVQQRTCRKRRGLFYRVARRMLRATREGGWGRMCRLGEKERRVVTVFVPQDFYSTVILSHASSSGWFTVESLNLVWRGEAGNIVGTTMSTLFSFFLFFFLFFHAWVVSFEGVDIDVVI